MAKKFTMRLWLLLFSSVVFSSFGAPVKLALVGVPEYVALLTAELSENFEFELFERAAINRVQQELALSASKMSATELCRLFPHADILALIGERSLRTFNAKNGFLLTDAEHSEDKQKMLADIHLAAGKTASDAPLLLGKLAHRDIGVPRRLQKLLPSVVASVERLLLADPNLQLLEREHLGLVSAERSLSGATFQLPPSALLMSMEFEPGETGDMVNLLIQVQNLKQQKIAEQIIENIFKQPDNIKHGVSSLCEKLNQINNQKVKRN